MYNIKVYEVSAESILLNHGGVKDKDLVKVVDSDLDYDNDMDVMVLKKCPQPQKERETMKMTGQLMA